MQQSPCEGRRSSFLLIKDDKIMSSDDYYLSKSRTKVIEAETHRQRSFSAGALPAQQLPAKSKIPNFKKYHEQQFEKMESLSDYTARKAERAKKLLTPPRLVSVSPSRQYTPPSSPLPTSNSAFKRTLSVNYKNSVEVPSKRFKVDTPIRSPSPTSIPSNESLTSSICSKTTSWLKGVRLNRRFQLLMNSQKKR